MVGFDAAVVAGFLALLVSVDDEVTGAGFTTAAATFFGFVVAAAFGADDKLDKTVGGLAAGGAFFAPDALGVAAVAKESTATVAALGFLAAVVAGFDAVLGLAAVAFESAFFVAASFAVAFFLSAAATVFGLDSAVAALVVFAALGLLEVLVAVAAFLTVLLLDALAAALALAALLFRAITLADPSPSSLRRKALSCLTLPRSRPLVLASCSSCVMVSFLLILPGNDGVALDFFGAASVADDVLALALTPALLVLPEAAVATFSLAGGMLDLGLLAILEPYLVSVSAQLQSSLKPAPAIIPTQRYAKIFEIQT